MSRVSLLFLGLLLLLATGCFWNQSEDSFTPGTGPAATTGQANVSFRLVIPGQPSGTSASIVPDVKAGIAGIEVDFQIVLANPTNPDNPSVTLNMTSKTDGNGQASATFNGLPLHAALGRVVINNGYYAGYSRFRGARDLTQGENVIELVPSGFGDPRDIVAHVFETIIRDLPLLRTASPQMVAQIHQSVTPLLPPPGASPSADIYDRSTDTFITTLNPQSLVRFTVSQDGKTVSVLKTDQTPLWQKNTADYFTTGEWWNTPAEEIAVHHVIRNGRNGTGFLAWKQTKSDIFAIGKIDMANGNLIAWVKNPGICKQVLFLDNGNLVIGGWHTGKGCPVVFCWSGSTSGSTQSPTGSSDETGLVWKKYFENQKDKTFANLGLIKVQGVEQIGVGLQDVNSGLITYVGLTPDQGIGEFPTQTPVTDNSSPTVAVTAPTSGTSLKKGTETTITATAQDQDGTIQWVDFFVRNSEGAVSYIGKDTSAPYQAVWTPTTNGMWQLFARTTDNLFGTGESTPITVLVTSVPVFARYFGESGVLPGRFKDPNGMVSDSQGYIYIADQGNHRVQKFNSSGAFVSSIGTFGSGNGQLNGPEAVAIDSSGNLYITDHYNYRLQKFNSSGVYLSQTGSKGTGAGQFGDMGGIAIDKLGYVFVADSGNHRLAKYDSNLANPVYLGSQGTIPGQFNYPNILLYGESSNMLYVTDSANGGRVQTMAADGSFANFITSGLSGPWGMALDSSRNFYVANRWDNTIGVYNPAGEKTKTMLSQGTNAGQVRYPCGIVIDSSGYLYVADGGNGRVQKFDSAGTYAGLLGTDGRAPQQFREPAGFSFDSSGYVYILDRANTRVQVFDSAGTFVKTWSGTGGGSLQSPMGMVSDSSGYLYVSDNVQNRVLKFDSSGNFQNWGSSLIVTNPTNLAIDQNGYIYLQDNSFPPKVQKIDSNGTNVGNVNTGQFMSSIAIDSSGYIYGIYTGTSDNVVGRFKPDGTLDSTFSPGSSVEHPQSVAIDSSGNVYIGKCVTSGPDIMKFDSAGVLLESFGTPDRSGTYTIPQSLSVDSSGYVYVAGGNSAILLK